MNDPYLIKWFSPIFLVLYLYLIIVRKPENSGWSTAGTLRKSFFIISTVIYVALIAFDKMIPSTESLLNWSFSKTIAVVAMKSAVFSIISTELLRVIISSGRKWPPRKHFQIVIFCWFIFLVVSSTGNFMIRR